MHTSHLENAAAKCHECADTMKDAGQHLADAASGATSFDPGKLAAILQTIQQLLAVIVPLIPVKP